MSESVGDNFTIEPPQEPAAPEPSAYPPSRIMNIISLVLSCILMLVGIHVLTGEENFKNEHYFYIFIALYLMAQMLVKMVMIVKSDLTVRKIILAFLVELSLYLPLLMHDWETDKTDFALIMLLTNTARAAYYTFGVMKDSELV
ncbi:MAG: hypothetical protein L6Q81_03895 [Bacteroidia bacterium]|nr:hypothetical protein [Bacteroidia bacterium]